MHKSPFMKKVYTHNEANLNERTENVFVRWPNSHVNFM